MTDDEGFARFPCAGPYLYILEGIAEKNNENGERLAAKNAI